ncbi:MAG: TIGR01777 family oxidoreductase [Nocardioidaceae bacterium]
MLITMAGASGFLGTALRRHFESTGHAVTQLVRSEPTSPRQVRWDPYRGELDSGLLRESGAIINLAGAPVGHWPWTANYKRQILDSRVATTATISTTIASLDKRPVLLNASGINYYGDHDEVQPATEESQAGVGFLADVTRRWEAAAEPAATADTRVVKMRTAVVLDKSGGALKTMLLPFKLGVGGRFGNGRQYFPTISLHDYVAAVHRLMTDEALSGAFNLVAPVPATNGEFTQELGARLHRPTVLTVPAFALKKIAGDLSREFLGSVHAVPKRLLEAGFEFAHPTVGQQLDAALAKR